MGGAKSKPQAAWASLLLPGPPKGKCPGLAGQGRLRACVYAHLCVNIYLYSSVSGLNLYTITLVPQITISGHRKIFLGQLWTILHSSLI